MKQIYFAAIAGNLGLISVGQYFGWTSPSLSKLMQENHRPHLNAEEASWVAVFLLIGSSIGSFISAFSANIAGRKNSMLFAAFPGIIGCVMIAFATSIWELYIGRLMCGLSIGISYVVTPMYLGEISPANIRGTLGSMLTVAAKFGTLIAFTIGPFLSVKNFSLVSLTAPFLFVMTFIWLPESPYQLMRRGDRQGAIKSLIQLRGHEDVCMEADNIEQAVKADLANETGFREILFVPGNRRALITVMCLMLLQQFTGSQVFLQYAELIFNEMNVNLEGKYLTIILGASQTISSVMCMFLTDHCGRRILLIISSIGTACSTAIIGIYFYLQHNHTDVKALAWTAAICMIAYMITYTLGIGTLPFTLIGELFPTNVKALSSMLIMTSCNAGSLIVVKCYVTIVDNFEIHTAMWIFSMSGVIAALFTFFYMHETNGKTLERIQKELHNHERPNNS